MKRLLHIIFGISILSVSCTSDETTELSPFQTHQKEQHEFMLSEDSPIDKEERKKFISLNYFSHDSAFVFNAKYESVFNGNVVEFATNTDRKPLYVHVGNIIFKKDNKTQTLRAYQPQKTSDNSLFVPFSDLTNGNESYKSGRYLDLNIPDMDIITLDFNLAYNPYCAYNKKYSCPIPPVENQLNIEIKAGEKTYR